MLSSPFQGTAEGLCPPFLSRGGEVLLTVNLLMSNRSGKAFLPFQSIGGQTEMRDNT